MKPTRASSDRRQFLKTGGAVAAGLLAQGAVPARAATTDLGPMPANPRTMAAMPTRNLGKTGYKVGIFSLGGQAALEKPDNFDLAVHRAGAGPGRELYRHVIDLWRAVALERAVCGPGD